MSDWILLMSSVTQSSVNCHGCGLTACRLDAYILLQKSDRSFSIHNKISVTICMMWHMCTCCNWSSSSSGLLCNNVLRYFTQNSSKSPAFITFLVILTTQSTSPHSTIHPYNDSSDYLIRKHDTDYGDILYGHSATSSLKLLSQWHAVWQNS